MYLPDLDRLFSKFEIGEPNECWEWKGTISTDGYGQFCYRNRVFRAHRLIHQMVNERSDLQLHHVCSNKTCVNPYHLELVTAKEHVAKTPTLIQWSRAAKEFCLNGHPLSGENLYINPKAGTRSCKICRKDALERHYGLRV